MNDVVERGWSWGSLQRKSVEVGIQISSCFFKVAYLRKDGTIVLKERLYKEVQENWPGYLIEERQLLRRILIR